MKFDNLEALTMKISPHREYETLYTLYFATTAAQLQTFMRVSLQFMDLLSDTW